MTSENLRTSFEMVIREYETERQSVRAEMANLQRRLRELDQTITSLYRKLGVQPPSTPIVPASRSIVPSNQKYAAISVHWAILHLLREAKSPMSTAQIAEALTAGGVRTRAANFSNNVSAVLSTSMRPKGEEEVEAVEGGWKLTEIGQSKAAHVIASQRFRQACPWIACASNGA